MSDESDAGSAPSVLGERPELPADPRINRRQGVALGVAAALTLAGAAYSLSTLDSRQALASRPTPAVSAQRPPSRPPSSPSSAAASPPGSVIPSGSATASPSGSAATSPASADGFLQPPAPWGRLADTAAKTGRVTLARAVEIDGHGALSRTGLLTLGFSAGQSRAWQAGSAALLVLDYTFRDAKNAAGFVSYGRRARDSDAGFRRVPVTGVPGAVAYRSSEASPGTRVVLFFRGRHAYIVGVQGPLPSGPAGDLNVLARLQYAAGG
jgi:hypothetical protein